MLFNVILFLIDFKYETYRRETVKLKVTQSDVSINKNGGDLFMIHCQLKCRRKCDAVPY